MPLYRYCCSNCGVQFEDILKVADRDNQLAFACNRCGAFDIFRVPGCGGFHLKGFCWSRDNYSRSVGDDPRGHFQKNEDL